MGSFISIILGMNTEKESGEELAADTTNQEILQLKKENKASKAELQILKTKSDSKKNQAQTLNNDILMDDTSEDDEDLQELKFLFREYVASHDQLLQAINRKQ